MIYAKTFLIIFIVLLISCKERVFKPVTKAVSYEHTNEPMEGYLVFNGQNDNKRPGILVIHEWTGLGDYVKGRTKMLAKLGYVAFAMDMYGKGKRAKNHEEAGRLMQRYTKDPELMLSRIRAALKILKDHPITDKNNIAAIGYCFGGGAVLHLAFSGEPIKGVVSFHGVLKPPTLEKGKKIRAKLLIHHGEKDSFIPEKDVVAFQKALKEANVSYEFISHEGAVHGFTRKSAGGDPSKGIAYDLKADETSWASMKSFFKEELFKQ